MALIFLFVAVLFIVVGVRGQSAPVAALLTSEFTGANSFVPWFLAIMFIGVIGYWKPARPVADAFLGLVILVLFLGKGGQRGTGFFQAISQLTTSATPTTGSSAPCSLADDPANCLQAGVTTGPGFDQTDPLAQGTQALGRGMSSLSSVIGGNQTFSSMLDLGQLNKVPVY